MKMIMLIYFYIKDNLFKEEVNCPIDNKSNNKPVNTNIIHIVQ